MEKVFFINKTNEPLYIQLYHVIVSEIKENKLQADEKLPSVRSLAKTMNMSKTTIESCYGQLIAEGYLYAKPQKGYFVMPIKVPLKATNLKRDSVAFKFIPEEKASDKISEGHLEKPEMIDFVSEYVEESNFDMAMWKRNITKVLSENEQALFSLASATGEVELKEEIVQYFTRMRGISAQKEQIIISAGTSSLLRELAELFLTLNFHHFAIEDPGFNVAKDVFRKANYSLEPVKLCHNVMDVSALRGNRKRIIFTSPSYQFPYGEIMPAHTRYELLAFAKKTQSYIIEDDYNNELRYVGKPVASLQGMDHEGNVIYIGSFSTLLIPSIRISFMVLPLSICGLYKERFGSKVQSASKLEQLALARMLKSGDFARHIRKLRKNYRQKHRLMVQLCKMHLSDYCHIEIPPAGISAILELKKEVPRKKIELLSKEMNIKISPLSYFLLKKNGERLENKLVLNYRGIKEDKLEAGLLKVKELLCQMY